MENYEERSFLNRSISPVLHNSDIFSKFMGKFSTKYYQSMLSIMYTVRKFAEKYLKLSAFQLSFILRPTCSSKISAETAESEDIYQTL